MTPCVVLLSPQATAKVMLVNVMVCHAFSPINSEQTGVLHAYTPCNGGDVAGRNEGPTRKIDALVRLQGSFFLSTRIMRTKKYVIFYERVIFGIINIGNTRVPVCCE